MKRLNHTQVSTATRQFWICFLLLSIFTYISVYFFYKSCQLQSENIAKDIAAYKDLLNKHGIVKAKTDSLYNQLALLNTGKVENNLFLEKYIADNKNEIVKIIGADSTIEFKHCALLMNNVESILKQKDTILTISNKEHLALSDLMECMNKTRKVKKDRVWLDIRLTPYFPAKSFVIKLDGHKGDDGNQWDAEYAQEA